MFVLDNTDWEFKVHMHSNKQNKSVHAIATSIVFDCIAADFPDNGPKKCLNDGNMRDLLNISAKGAKEQRCTREWHKISWEESC